MPGQEIVPVDIEIQPVSYEDIKDLAVVATSTAGGIEPTGRGVLRTIGQLADRLIDVAPEALGATEGAGLYKVVLPEGYSATDLVKSAKGDGTVRGILRDAQGNLNGDVAFELQGLSATQVASMGLAAAAVVVGQAYMTQINDSLKGIDAKLDLLNAKFDADKRATVSNALKVALESVLYFGTLLDSPSDRKAQVGRINAQRDDVTHTVEYARELLDGLLDRVKAAQPKKKELEPLVDELNGYDQLVEKSAEALTALAVCRMMYGDNAMTQKRMLAETESIRMALAGYEETRTNVAAVLNLQIGAMKGMPLAIPEGDEDSSPAANPLEAGVKTFRRLISQTPWDAAAEQDKDDRMELLGRIQHPTDFVDLIAEKSTHALTRAIEYDQQQRTLITDGVTYYLVEGAA